MAILKIVIIYIAIHLLISRDRLFWERSFVTFVLLPYFFVHAIDHLFCLSEKDSMVNLYFDSVYILTAILCWDSGCVYLCLFVTLCIISKKFNSYCSNNNCVSNTSTLSSITCNWITVKIAEWWWVLNYMWCEIQTNYREGFRHRWFLTLIFVMWVTAHSFCRSNILQNSVFEARYVGEIWLKFTFPQFQMITTYIEI
jgi:hypothetical protein